jgi:serine protease Do
MLMKTHFRCLLPLLGVAALLPVGAGTEKNDAPPPAKQERREMRVLVHHPNQDLPKEPVTFLGVETMPVSPTLIAQLGLTDGTGLVVTHVVPDSPAAGALQQHDVLLKLDDQWLIEVRQLAVLVRNHQKNDEVTLTFLRGGKQQTARLKLVKREMPKLSQHLPFEGGSFDRPFRQATSSVGVGTGGNVEFLQREVDGDAGTTDERMMGLLESAPSQASVRIFERHGGSSPGVTMLNPGKSQMLYSDEAGTLELKLDDGKKELTAKDPKGAVIFTGPVNTPAERQALPESVRPRLEKILQMRGFSFTPDGDFRPGEPVVRPLPGRQISLPTPATVPTLPAPAVL